MGDRSSRHSRCRPRVVVHERELPEALSPHVRRADLGFRVTAREQDEAPQRPFFDYIEVLALLVLQFYRARDSGGTVVTAVYVHAVYRR